MNLSLRMFMEALVEVLPVIFGVLVGLSLVGLAYIEYFAN